MTNTKFGLNMTDDDKHLNPNWTVGTSANDSHEHTGDKLDEMKLEMIALKAQVQVLQTENKQLVEEKKIQEDKYSKLEKEMRERLLKRKLQESQDKFTEQKFRSLEENHLKEITELKVKNQKLTEDFDEKIKKLEEMNQQKISETCNEIMVPIREFSQLPLENWHDLLAFVPRNQLGNVVSEIGDRQFAYIIQSFLHDRVRKITLGQMEIIPPRRNLPNDQPVVKVWSNMAANMPDWPMPENIKSFVEINLNYVDMSVLPFLGKFKENSLLTDVNMCFNFGNFLRILDEDILLRVLIKIAPFITSIDSISSPEIDLFDVVYNNFYNKKSRLLLEEMLAKTRILLTNWCTDESECSWGGIMDNTCYWLYTPRDDEKPRMLKSYASIYESTNYYSFIERIKKDFEMANDPASFFIYVDIGENIEDISLENLKTSEKLVIKMKPNGNWKMLLISRYPLKAAKNWIEANEKEISEWITSTYLDRRIYMDDELTIAM